VAALRGGLRVETTPGGGATFILTLPVARHADRAGMPGPSGPPGPVGGRAGPGKVVPEVAGWRVAPARVEAPEAAGRREGRG
jgi:hypothetical protein